MLYWRDRHLRFHRHDQVEPSPDIGDLLHEIDHDLIVIFWDRPPRLGQSPAVQLTVPLPMRARPALCSLGYEGAQELTDCPRRPPNLPAGSRGSGAG